MLVPYRWLKDYVSTDLSVNEIAEKMIMTGNLIEGIEELGNDIHNVVVGKILKIEPHPDADKLKICHMDVGEESPIIIVTGADNVFEGAYVSAALCGAVLPNGMKIKKSKLRGVESFGMLCSGEELVIKDSDYPGAEVDGILILKEEYAPGTDIKSVLMMDDVVIEFEVGANRPDCLSIIGIAKEAAAALNVPARLPEPTFGECGGDISEYISVSVEDAELCPRYMARAVKNVKIGESPRYIKERLQAAGMRPINNIVDITNFVMLETGQPMHAFDRRYVRGGKIIVRRADNGETLTTLDGKTRNLNSSMLLIADAESAIGIAGIMGGENSEIRDDTSEVIFESATFMYGSVRQTSRALGLSTESSMRYSKGADTVNAEFALNRACQLVEQLGAGEVVSGVVDINNDNLSDREIICTATEINSLLGTSMTPGEMKLCLDRLSLCTRLEGDKMFVQVPHIRADIYGKADIAEEVARIFGYDNIPETNSVGELMAAPDNRKEATMDVFKFYIVANGYYECMNYSFIGESAFDKLRLPESHPLRRAVRIINPIGDDSALMRTTLIPSILDCMSLNLKRKNQGAMLYEMARVYIPKEIPLKRDELPDERLQLVLAISDGDFYTLKGHVEKLLEPLVQIDDVSFEPGGGEYFHPGRCAKIYVGGEYVGELGEIHPEVMKAFDLSTRVYVANIDIPSLTNQFKSRIRFRQLPRYPAVERDIALVMDKDVMAGDVKKCIKKYGGKYLESVQIFDVYEGSQIGENKKSIAFSLIFRSPDSTLTDEESSTYISKILDAASREHNAVLR